MFSSVNPVSFSSKSCSDDKDKFGLASLPVSLLLLSQPAMEVGRGREVGLGVSALQATCWRRRACNGLERVLERFGLWIIWDPVPVPGGRCRGGF
jgi:hypothetical protein